MVALDAGLNRDDEQHFRIMSELKRNTNSREHRRALGSLLASLVVHATILFVAYRISIDPKPTSPLTVEIAFESMPPLKEPTSDLRKQASQILTRIKSGVPKPQDTFDAPVSISERIDTSLRVDSAVSNPSHRVSLIAALRDVLSDEITEGQAFGMLDSLLKKYPQFRNSIMRSMLAGPHTGLDKIKGVDTDLRRWTHRPDWLKLDEYAYRYWRNYKSPYDPVHGFDRDKKLGVQAGYLGLLVYLIQWLINELK